MIGLKKFLKRNISKIREKENLLYAKYIFE